MDDLIERLRALSRHEHDDLSIGDEAAGEIERLRDVLNIITGTVGEAIERAGLEPIDDPGEAIEIITNERDALRARIEGAMVVKATRNGIVRSEARMALIGKRVALVVLE